MQIHSSPIGNQTLIDTHLYSLGLLRFLKELFEKYICLVSAGGKCKISSADELTSLTYS